LPDKARKQKPEFQNEKNCIFHPHQGKIEESMQIASRSLKNYVIASYKRSEYVTMEMIQGHAWEIGNQSLCYSERNLLAKEGRAIGPNEQNDSSCEKDERGQGDEMVSDPLEHHPDQCGSSEETERQVLFSPEKNIRSCTSTNEETTSVCERRIFPLCLHSHTQTLI
jgi:hypothetical protein